MTASFHRQVFLVTVISCNSWTLFQDKSSCFQDCSLFVFYTALIKQSGILITQVNVDNTGSTYFIITSDTVGTGTNKRWLSYFSLRKHKSKDYCYSWLNLYLPFVVFIKLIFIILNMQEHSSLLTDHWNTCTKKRFPCGATELISLISTTFAVLKLLRLTMLRRDVCYVLILLLWQHILLWFYKANHRICMFLLHQNLFFAFG